MIAVGHCRTSNGLQFYNPANGTLISSIDYKLQTNVTSGARFGNQYQPGTFIYRLGESTTMLTPMFALESKVLVHTHSLPYVATVIGIPVYNTLNRYTITFKDGSISEYDSNILSVMDEILNQPSASLLPSWIQPGANVTLFLHSMARRRHGKLQINDQNECFFVQVLCKILQWGLYFLILWLIVVNY
jgi:hypothetical protein